MARRIKLYFSSRFFVFCLGFVLGGSMMASPALGLALLGIAAGYLVFVDFRGGMS